MYTSTASLHQPTCEGKGNGVNKAVIGLHRQNQAHLVPFTDVQTSFVGIGQDNLIITFMRRAMLRIASSLAEREGALAIVTGDSLGQVASQTRLA